MEGIDHHLGRLIRWQSAQELAPELVPHLTGQKVALQLRPQQCSGFTPEALDHVTEIDPPQWPLLTLTGIQARDCQGELAAQEQLQPVMAQMDGELLADQA